jgi:hypothetical protein
MVLNEHHSPFTMGSLRTLSILVLATLAFALPLRAGPPLLTDDPDTPGPGHWEINVATAFENADSEWEWGLPILDINYGIGEHIQLKYEIPWIVMDLEGEDAKSGIGNSEFGIKWRFLDEDRHGIAMSTYPQIAFNTRSSSVDRGLVDDGSEFVLPFQIAKTFGPVLVFAEAGYAWLEHGSDEWIYGIAAEYEVSESLALLAEIFGGAEEGFHNDGYLFNVGFKYHFDENIALMGSAGRSLQEPKGEEEHLLSYLGFQFTF